MKGGAGGEMAQMAYDEYGRPFIVRALAFRRGGCAGVEPTVAIDPARAAAHAAEAWPGGAQGEYPGGAGRHEYYEDVAGPEGDGQDARLA